MNKVAILLLALCLSLAIGCASVPTPVVVQANTAPAEEETHGELTSDEAVAAAILEQDDGNNGLSPEQERQNRRDSSIGTMVLVIIGIVSLFLVGGIIVNLVD